MSDIFVLLSLAGALTGHWKSYTNTNFVNGVAGTPDTLYLATYGGLQLFQASSSSFLQAITNADGLPSNNLSCCLVDGAGGVWIGTQDAGLAVFDPSSGRVGSYQPDMLPLKISCLTRSGDTILVGSDNGAALIDTRGTSFNFADDVLSYIDGLSSATVLSVAMNQNIWVGSNLGVDRVTRDLQVQHFTSPLGDSVKAIVDKDDTIFIATEQGISRFDSTAGQLVAVAAFTQSQLVYGMAAFNGALYVATGSGVFQLSDSGFTTVWGGECRSLWSGGADLWIGLGSPVPGNIYVGNGIGRLSRSGAQSGFLAPGLASNKACCLALDTAGDIYACHQGTYGGIRAISVLADNGGSWVLQDSVANACLVCRDSHNRLWFGHWGVFISGGGLSVYDPASRTWNAIFWSNDPNQEEFRNVIAGLGIDRFDTKWVFNQTGEVVAIDSNGVQESFTVPGVTPPTSGGYNFAFDARNRAWFGTTAGLAMIDYAGTLHNHSDDTLLFFNQGLNSTNTNVQNVAVDNSGRPWVATGQGAGPFVAPGLGADSLKKGTFHLYTTDNSRILSNLVISVRIDSWGDVWFLTDRGLSVFDPRSGEWSQPGANRGLMPNLQGEGGFYKWLELDEPRHRVVVGCTGGISVFTFDTSNLSADSALIHSRVYPNPFIQGHSKGIFFDSLPDNVRIRVYTLSGELVADDQTSANLQVSPTYHIAEWRPGPDGKLLNQSGREIASGLYLAVITSPKEKRILRFAVVR
jgi:hypothetical protein